MWTKKTRLVLIYFRIAFIPIPMIFPMRCMHEIIEGYQDFLAPFKRLFKKADGYLKLAEDAMMIVKNYEPLDLVDVNVKSRDKNGKKERVVVKIVTR